MIAEMILFFLWNVLKGINYGFNLVFPAEITLFSCLRQFF